MIVQASIMFRKRLREAMEAKKMSQRELAKRAQTGYSGINRILQGEQNPTLDVADRLADAVGVELVDLLPGKKSSKNQ